MKVGCGMAIVREVLRCANITKRNYKIKKLKKRGYFVVHFCYIKV